MIITSFFLTTKKLKKVKNYECIDIIKNYSPTPRGVSKKNIFFLLTINI